MAKTLRKNYSCNYKHQLKRLKNRLKLNKWNNYQAYLCGNFWNKLKVEMRKFDCNSFRITVNTNFKKKLTSFVSKSVWRNPAVKVKVATEIRRHTAGGEAVVFRPSLNDCYEWTLRNKIIHTEVIFWKTHLKTQKFLNSNEIRLFQRNVQLTFLIDAMKT